MIRNQSFLWGYLAEIQKLFVGKELVLHDKYGNEAHRDICDYVEDINRDTEQELFNNSWVVRIKFKGGAEYILSNIIYWNGEKLLALTKSPYEERTFSVVRPENAKIKIVTRKGLKPGLQLASLEGRKGVSPALRKTR